MEIARYMQRETEKEGNGGDADKEREEFKEQIAKDKIKHGE